jgi:DNA polymerase-1
LQRTGRSSVTDPGLTVFGKRNGRHRERGIFLPDVVLGDDYEPNTHVLFSVDLAQMDARVIGALSQDHAYLDLFEPGVDSHREVARMVWGDPSRREEAKPLSHGTNYGMGPDKLSREAGIPFEEAEAFQGKMAALFPRLEAWKHEVRDFGKANGWVGNGFGRKVMIDRNRSWTQAPAGAGQAGTRDILMQGAIDLYDVDPRILRMLKAMVHDEFVFSVPRKYAVEVRHIVVKTLSGQWCPPGASRPVPVVADASPFATRWSGCYEKG